MARNAAQALKIARRREAGQTIALVAFGMLTFLAAAGLAVDMGYLRWERRLMQTAADSAALAAATDLNFGDSTMAQADALAVAQANGFASTTVTYNGAPPVTPGQAAQVTISQAFPTFFIQVVGGNSNTITASAVATMGVSEGCMVALQPGGLGLTVNGDISAANCGVVDNGPINGSGTVTSPSIGIYGDPSGFTGAHTTPVEHPIAPPAPDPLAYVNVDDVPTPPACISASTLTLNAVATLPAGNYCGGIIITDGAVVTFSSGLYYLTPGPSGAAGLQINGTGIATGAGVAFYDAPGGGPITFSGTGAVSFTADPAGLAPLPGGFLFYQDPGNTAAADLSEGGSGNVTLYGVLYFPSADLTLAGSLNPGENAVVVAQSITIDAGAPAIISNSTDTALFPTGSPLQSVTLVQ